MRRRTLFPSLLLSSRQGPRLGIRDACDVLCIDEAASILGPGEARDLEEGWDAVGSAAGVLARDSGDGVTRILTEEERMEELARAEGSSQEEARAGGKGGNMNRENGQKKKKKKGKSKKEREREAAARNWYNFTVGLPHFPWRHPILLRAMQRADYVYWDRSTFPKPLRTHLERMLLRVRVTKQREEERKERATKGGGEKTAAAAGGHIEREIEQGGGGGGGGEGGEGGRDGTGVVSFTPTPRDEGGGGRGGAGDDGGGPRYGASLAKIMPRRSSGPAIDDLRLYKSTAELQCVSFCMAALLLLLLLLLL